ncbi:alpha/beta hydrolase [Corynebacterium sp. TAE3-ERU12]|uniref:alpha/beta hydrolase family protein n=1 Tax=Corynebacterium sp. TAE3-ERU12 TaxID=2849491 RepID=UPI001C4755DB|nr:alpha/beta hydrolase [Corynebacterium sp. TAE3-ERU12]MBV7294897.1 alpha/beta hydrolase [Corynebacterium sp. TAE3-ERU12]
MRTHPTFRRDAIATACAAALIATPMAPAMAAPGSSASDFIDRFTGPIDNGEAPAGSVRAEYSTAGPHTVAATQDPHSCESLFMRVYTGIATKTQGLNKAPECYGYAPEDALSPAGIEYIYPSDLAPGEKAPLIVLSPGIGAEPGMLDEQARLYASHGYIVAMGFTTLNWFGVQLNAAALGAVISAQEEGNPLYDHIDFTNTALVGHSAGGGSALTVAGAMEKSMQPLVEGFSINAIVGQNPGPSEFGIATVPTDAKTLVIVADKETVAPAEFSRMRYDQITNAPAWWVGTRNTTHASAIDYVDNSPVAGLTLSFLQYAIRGDANAKALYTGAFTLQHDPELFATERNAQAQAL